MMVGGYTSVTPPGPRQDGDSVLLVNELDFLSVSLL